ncbi:MAG: bifunctional acetate--CoA ligase family protein/GNAT family N-acetyltransferase [Syntrophorhabdaceae bacterium]
MKPGDMNALFNPKTIALVGATDKNDSVGRSIMENLIGSGNRKIFPVNTKRDVLFGRECHPNILAIHEEVDLAVIATPAATVPAIVDECGQAGVAGIIIISAGFKETGEAGKRLEDEIIEIRKKYGMRIIGPNCIGVLRPTVNLNTTFLKSAPEAGVVAFISQSGALGSAILDWAVRAHIGFSMFTSLGSMIDVDFADLIDYVGEDYKTRSIMLYMEGIGNARRFMSSARGFARTKPIVIIKPGKYRESAGAALSHTGSMAGDDQVYDAAFKRVGVIRVNEFSDLFNAASVLDSKYLPRGNKLAIITNAGGFGVMATDTLIGLGGMLAQLSDETKEKLNAALPNFWSRGNPIDILGDADAERYSQAIQACLDDRGIDGILVIYSPQAVLSPDVLAEAVAALAKSSAKPILTAWVGGNWVESGRTVLLRNSIPTYESPEDAVRTYLHMYHYRRNLTLLYETPSELGLEEGPAKNHLKAFIRRVANEKRALLTEEESKRFLITYGIHVTIPQLAKTPDQAIQMAHEIGYPVVLKIVSPDITHKTDVGGVATGINSGEDLGNAWQTMMRRVKTEAPDASITGISVQKMVQNIDYELIIGAKKDNDFGTVILFGMGGIGTEIFKDISIGLPPLNQILARRMMQDTRIYGVLKGFRGRRPADMKNLEELIVNFSNMIVDFPEIGEMDINPVVIAEGKAYALDARIVLDFSQVDHKALYPHMIITPYPARYVINWRFMVGTVAVLRPIKPEDEPMEYEMLTTLSKESLRVRFFSIIKDISHEMLMRFCNIDYDREIAMVAEIFEPKRRIIGISRLIADPGRNAAEYAIVIHDDYHGKGLGYKLLDVLIGIAQDKGLDEIYGSVLSENDRMLSIAVKLGFKITREPDGVSHVSLALK